MTVWLRAMGKRRTHQRQTVRSFLKLARSTQKLTGSNQFKINLLCEFGVICLGIHNVEVHRKEQTVRLVEDGWQLMMAKFENGVRPDLYSRDDPPPPNSSGRPE